ncbi:STAS domain-containing protein [Kitasatospora sp. NPDC048298]|uniref:STAS domain-containing protein n=1 Tax=Kitasatospora sp. NPDC048298 TaxID=3364049 RepID=UPI00371C7626
MAVQAEKTARRQAAPPVAAFAKWLQGMKIAAGDPSHRELQRRTARSGWAIPRSTLHDGLSGVSLMPLDYAIRVLRVLGYEGPAVEAECRARWTSARKGVVITEPTPPGPGDPARRFVFEKVVPHAAPDAVAATTSPLDVEVGTLEAWTVVRVVGELDCYGAPALRQLLNGLAEPHTEQQPLHLVIDMSGCSFVDSGGLGLLIFTSRRMMARGTVLRLVLSPTGNEWAWHVIGFLTNTRIQEFVPMYVPIYESVSAAIHGARPAPAH